MESILQQPAVPLPSSSQLDQTSIHLLPCGINHDGKANISNFFFLVDGQYPSVLAPDGLSVPKPVSAPDAGVTEAAAAVTAVENLHISSTTTTGATTGNSSDAATATTTSTTRSTSTVPEVSLRGRTLKGTVVSIPEGYIGTVYKSFDHAPQNGAGDARDEDAASTLDEDEEYEAMLKGMQEERKVMTTQAQFKEFTMWGHDDQPTLKSEKVLRAMQWIDIASVLHKPLS
ncbi:ribonuclease H2, subunit C [Mortierella sp. GBAus27b]|nr:hypothetical protein BGX31_003736 [Mortierella sp. GBA43]KAI8354250.1 ribonuclease H2, subunit C [Mortierella sp. GBAus27b]